MGLHLNDINEVIPTFLASADVWGLVLQTKRPRDCWLHFSEKAPFEESGPLG